MKKNLLRLFALLSLMQVQSQNLPSTYPAYFFTFEESDSSSYLPIYSDQISRDSIKEMFNNSHQQARAIEEYELKEQKIDFLKRQEENSKIWEIKLTNGSTFEFRYPRYIADCNFEHYFPKYEIIVFRAQYGEGNGYQILDRRTGKNVGTFGPPQFSPSGRYFICMNDDVEANYSSNGIQLFEFVNNEPELQLQYRMDYGPSRANWIDNGSLQLEVYSSNMIEYRGFVRSYRHYKMNFYETE